MSLFRKPKVLTLQDWLEIATGKLAKPARERIRAEIEAHYTEARDTHYAEAQNSHQEDEMSKWNAHLAALEDLGDARIAAKRFRREHLTEREAQILKLWDRHGSSLAWLLTNYVITGGFLFCMTIGRRHIHWVSVPPMIYVLIGSALILAQFGFLPTFRFIAARRGRANLNRILLLMQALNLSVFGVFLCVLLYMMSRNHLPTLSSLAQPLICIFGPLFTGLNLLGIWRKLGRMEMGWNDNRPAGAA